MLHLPEVDERARFKFKQLASGPNGHFSVYTAGWRLIDKSDETWTSRFNNAKDGNPNAIRRIVEATKAVFNVRNSAGGPILVVPALPSGAPRSVEGSLVNRLAQAIASTGFNLHYEPELIEHSPRQSLHHGADKNTRVQLLNGSHSLIDPDRDFSGYKILLVDDFVTTGTTLSEMARVFSDAVRPPRDFLAIAVAKNERVRYAAGQGEEINNHHISEEYAAFWED